MPYLFEREGTNCENLTETHEFLKSLRAHVDERYPGKMFLAEANQWPEDAVAYFGQGDECHMAFHFPLMPRLFMALHQEDRFPIHDIMAQTPAIPDNCQWCLFLRNHDELTLEMVTDEERDYMYRAYALDRHARINLGIRHRLAPLLRNDRRRIELMFALLFSLPGTPVIYYGDEIGMGDNIYLGDRNGVRTPMQWSADRNAGFSRANPQKLYLPVVIDPEYYYETVNVEAQQGNPSSLLWWVKRLVNLRKTLRAFGRGTFRLLYPENPKMLAFVRELDDEQLVLFVANLSRFVQYVQLDLKEYSGVVPEEVLGRTRFPPITDAPYLLTLGPHAFIWFSLPVAAAPSEAGLERPSAQAAALPELPGSRTLAQRFQPANRGEIEFLLPGYLRRHRLVAARSRVMACEIKDVAPIRLDGFSVYFLIVRVEPRGGVGETISLPLTFVPADQIDELLVPREAAWFAGIPGPEPGALCDALAVPGCCRLLLREILTGRSQQAEGGEIEAGVGFKPQSGYCRGGRGTCAVTASGASWDSSTTVNFGEEIVLDFWKAFHRIEEGVNPDVEIGRYLTGQADYHGIAPLAGYLEYRRRGAEPTTLGVLHGYVPNQGTAWQFTLDQLSQFFERVATIASKNPPKSSSPLAQAAQGKADAPEDLLRELVGGYAEGLAAYWASERPRCTPQLAANRGDATFAPRPFGKQYQRSIYQSFRNLTGRLCERLTGHRHTLSEAARPLTETIIRQQATILERFRLVLEPSIGGQRIRCHGDYQLGRLLHTGKDFVIIDCEGDTTRTIGERRVKTSPLRDVASMIRSLDYAAQSVVLGVTGDHGRPPGMIRDEDRPALEPWAFSWYDHVTREFLSAYYTAIQSSGLLPQTDRGFYDFLELLLLEKAFLEIDAELTDRPDWLLIPLRGAIRLLGNDPANPALLL